ncbi:MAG: hypothetical protein R2827_03315 [Bdellovibrionales bacterium]
MIDPPSSPKWKDKDKKSVEMGKMIKQCHRSGRIFHVDVPLVLDESPRTVPISLRVGHETINAAFCKTCAEKIRPQYQALLDKLIEYVGRKEQE